MPLIDTAFSTPPSDSLFSDPLSDFHFLSIFFYLTSNLALLFSYSAIPALLLLLYTNKFFMTCFLRLISCPFS